MPSPGRPRCTADRLVSERARHHRRRHRADVLGIPGHVHDERHVVLLAKHAVEAEQLAAGRRHRLLAADSRSAPESIIALTASGEYRPINMNIGMGFSLELG